MRSYASPGCDAASNAWEYGYIVVDGQYLVNASYGLIPGWPNWRGVNTMILDPSKCTASGWRQFDTWVNSSNAQDLVDYLNYLSDGLIVLVVSFDESRNNLAPALKSLKTAGADLNSLQIGGIFAFVMQKGFPHKTLIQMSNPGCNPLEITVKVTGAFYHYLCSWL